MRRQPIATIVLAAGIALGACGGPDGSGSPPEVIQGSAEPQPVKPPVLAVAPICLGVPFAECKDLAQSAAGSGAVGGGPPIGRVTVRCTAVCTPRKGEGETRVDYLDGSSMTSGWGYESSGG